MTAHPPRNPASSPSPVAQGQPAWHAVGFGLWGGKAASSLCPGQHSVHLRATRSSLMACLPGSGARSAGAVSARGPGAGLCRTDLWPQKGQCGACHLGDGHTDAAPRGSPTRGLLYQNLWEHRICQELLRLGLQGSVAWG